MNRLTCNKLSKNLRSGCFVNPGKTREEERKYSLLVETAPTYEEIYKKLADYEDAEEQGLLLRLPCKVGDKIYKPNPITLKEVVEINIESIFITLGRVNISGRTTIMKYTFCCSPSDFGKTVFLTKEEAEQELANRQQSQTEVIKDERNGR